MLTNTTFNALLSDNVMSLLFMHEEKCVYCDDVYSMWSTLYEANKEEFPDMKFGFINVEEFTDIKDNQEVEKTPQIRLYLNKGFFSFFEDEFTKDNLQSFLDYHLKTLAEPIFIDSDRVYVRYTNKANSIILSFADVTDEEKDFATGLQKVIPNIPVYYILNRSKYNFMTFAEDSSKSEFKMKMKRNFDEGDKFLGTKEMFLPRHLLKIIWPLRKNKIEVFSEKHLKNIFRLKKEAVFLFDEDYNSETAEHFSKAVLNKNYPGLALKSKLEEEGSDRLRVFFGVSLADFPAVRAVKFENNELVKFKITDDLTTDSLENFLGSIESGELKGYRKNQRKQDNTGRKVLFMNREEYYTQVEDSKTNFVVAFVGKDYKAMEELLKSAQAGVINQKEFTFGLVDVNLNDIDNLTKKKIPVIQILTKVQRKRFVTYDGAENVSDLTTYLNENVDVQDEL